MSKLGALAEQRWGLVTTAQAEMAGITRNQLSRMAAGGVLDRVAQGVYRLAGAPAQNHESVYATWLALGGATSARTETGVSAVVAAGITATVVHEIGDFFLERLDFIVPARKATRLPGVRLRARQLSRPEVIPVNGLPTLTVERTVADLVEQWTDLSLVAGVVRDAVVQGTLISPDRLVEYLDPISARQGRVGAGAGDGRSLAHALFELAGTFPEGWDRD